MHGCDNSKILNAVGLTEKDLFNNVQEKPRVVAEYIYTDEDNNPLYKVLRFEPKNFIQAKYSNGEWVFKMTGVRYVLYNLPNVIKSDVVYFVEGEKDADNLNKLGLVATTSVSGAAGFKKRAGDYVPFLSNKKVLIVPDNDKAGYNYAEAIKNALKETSCKIKVLKLKDVVPNLKEKEDVSDVILRYGKDKTLEFLNKLSEENSNLGVEFNSENVISSEIFEKLYDLEIENLDEYYKVYSKIKEFCRSKRITGFDKNYKKFKDSKVEKYIYDSSGLIFPELGNEIYNTIKYEVGGDNCIYENIPKIGKSLVSYQLIVPIEKYINLEDGSEKIKIAFYERNNWKYLIVDKSTIATTQSITKLADYGLEVNSDNATKIIKYLAEISSLNQDKIPVSASVSRLGWFENDVLIPYMNNYVFDNDKNFPNVQQKFSEKGNLEDWVEFLKERRKENSVSRIVLASAVASILLRKINQSGFTVHVWRRIRVWKNSSLYGRAINFWEPVSN